MRVLLIQPDYPTNYHYDPKTRIVLNPLGLEYIAAHVQDIAETRIFDNRPSNKKKLEAEIKSFNPDFVGISCNYTFQIYHVNSIAKIAKENGATTILGGWHPTIAPEDTLASPWVDMVVRSEGEITFRKLVQKNSPVGVKGISYKNNRHIIHNPDRELVDLNKMRFPARNHSSKERRKRYTFFGLPMECIETSRGCPFSCKFCCIHNFYRNTYRHRSVEHIIAELHQVKKITNFVHVVDDNFIVNPKHVLKLCEAIIRQKLNMFFETSVRIDTVLNHRDVFEKMARAGFFHLFLGIESYSNKTLKRLNKQFKFQEITSALRILKDLGFIVQGNVILGANVDDKIEDLESTIELTKTLDFDLATFSIMVPYPKTELRRELEENGTFLSKNWRDYTWVTPVIKYPHITTEQFSKYLDKAYHETMNFTHPSARLMQFIRARGLPFLISRFCDLTFLKSFQSIVTNYIQFRSSSRSNTGNSKN